MVSIFYFLEDIYIIIYVFMWVLIYLQMSLNDSMKIYYLDFMGNVLCKIEGVYLVFELICRKKIFLMYYYFNLDMNIQKINFQVRI